LNQQQTNQRETSDCPLNLIYEGNNQMNPNSPLTTEQFIKKAKSIHGNKYDYSKVNYIKSYIKVIIICPKHGEFLITPNNHLSKKAGCSICFGNKTLTTKQFIIKANDIHNNRYDYSLVQYINTSSKVKVKCNKHGIFNVTPNDHLSNCGCPDCGIEHSKELQRKPTKQFIIDAKKIHGNLYDYSLTKYINCKTKIIIICKKDGSFEQTPNAHLRGQGCPKCKKFKGEEKISSYLKEHNINFISQKRFEDCRGIKNPLPI
jgi:hypothetical protein